MSWSMGQPSAEGSAAGGHLMHPYPKTDTARPVFGSVRQVIGPWPGLSPSPFRTHEGAPANTPASPSCFRNVRREMRPFVSMFVIAVCFHVSFLYSEGVIPVFLLNSRLKCCGYSKPNLYATSLTDNCVLASNTLAQSTK